MDFKVRLILDLKDAKMSIRALKRILRALNRIDDMPWLAEEIAGAKKAARYLVRQLEIREGK